jgi:flagellar hook-associated protein 2
MGSPITFSGFNNIDFGVVLNAIVQQERAPIAAIETRRTTLQAQSTAFSTFATKLSALETAAEALADSDQLSKVTATSSSDTAVGISTGSATTTGSYEVVVTDLARSQVLASSTTYDSPDAVVATAGAISLARFGDPPVDVQITASMTLEEIAEAINNNPDAPVSAAVVQVTPGQYRLVLTGRATGTANAFTVQFSTPLSGGQGLNFTDTDNDGTFGEDAADNVQSANNAQLTVNRVPVTSSSNSVEDVIPGVTLQLKKKDPDAVITVDVSKDNNAALAQLDAFATAYNDLVKFLGEQSTAAASGKPAIGRDPLVRGLRDALRTEMMESQVGAGVFARLAEVGVGFDGTGKIVIDKTAFKNAMDASPSDVRKLFGGEDGGGGRFGALKGLIVEYTEAGGLVADMRERITDQVSALGTRIATLEEQLALRRASLQREFIAADRAMSQLSSQGSSLTQLAGQFRLF